MEENMLTVTDVLEISGVSKNTLYRDIKAGRIQTFKFRKNTRFRESDVLKYAEEKKNSEKVKLWAEKKNSTQPKN